jgi:hypothetical protein
MKPNFKLKPGESASDAITRLYRHIRQIDRNYQPRSHYASHVKVKQATCRPVLCAVK